MTKPWPTAMPSSLSEAAYLLPRHGIQAIRRCAALSLAFRSGGLDPLGGDPSGGGGPLDRAGKPHQDRIVAARHCGNNVTSTKKLRLAVA